MKKKLTKLILCIILTVMSSLSYSQEKSGALEQSGGSAIERTPKFIKMMQKGDENFYDVKDEYEKYRKNYPEDKRSFNQYHRWAYMTEQKVYPTGEMPKSGLAWEEMKLFKKKYAKSFENNKGNTWTEMGPGDIGILTGHWSPGVGRINVIVEDPSNSSTIYIGTPAGGIWRTTNGGTSWVPLSDNIPSLGVSGIVVDPNNSNIIYIGTGDKDQADTRGVGVLKSTDNGATWNETGLSYTVHDNMEVNKLIGHPTNSSILFAATNLGVFKTSNGGATWTSVLVGDIDDIEIKPNDPSVIYAATTQFYKSTDGGDTFNNIYVASAGRCQIAVTEAQPDYVYFYSVNGLFRSTNAGATFTLRAGYQGTNTQVWYDLALAANQVNAEQVYVGEFETHVSNNGGSSFTKTTAWQYQGIMSNYVHCDIHELVYYGNTLYVGSDGLICKSTDGGITFTNLTNGIGIRQLYKMGGSKTNASKVITGSQDNGTCFTSNDTWYDWLGADGMECIVDHTNENIMYGEIQNGSFYKTIDGGASSIGVANPGVGAWVTPYVMHPTNPEILYSGNTQISKTTNGMTSWTAIGNFGSGYVDALQISKSNPNYLYASKTSNLWVTKNDGGTWTQINNGLPTLTITYIAVHPENPEIAAISYSGYYANDKVYITYDAGATWTNYTKNLPNIPANCVEFDEGSLNELYVGMDVGVYYINNSKTEYEPYFTSMPNAPVRELEIHQASGKIRAATYGRGLWEADIYSSGPSAPSVITSSASSITENTAVCGGNVISDGGQTVTQRGICYSTSQNPTTSNSKLTSSGTTGTYTITINGLSQSTTYYVRAYAINSYGTSYGAQVSFVTTAPNSAPILTTSAATTITPNSAIVGGNVTSGGGLTVTQRGVCYSTSQNPTTSSSKEIATGEIGAYTVTIANLSSSTTYYVRAYAINSLGTSYGAQVSFTTLPPNTVPILSTNTIASIGPNSAIGGGDVTSDGGAPIIERGICYGTSSNPTTSNSKVTNTGTTGSYAVTMLGLTASTTYYVRAYAINEEGTAYGNQVSFTTPATLVCDPISSFPFTENFDGSALPLCWENINNGGSVGHIWQFGIIPGRGIEGTSGNYAYIDSDAANAGYNQNADLITPVLNFTGRDQVTLNFKLYFRSYAGSSAAVSYSINGGSTWTVIESWTATTPNPDINSIDVSSQVAGQSNVKFKWNFIAVDGWYISLDEIEVTASAAQISAPTVITNSVTSITENSAVAAGNVSYDGGATVTQRGICYSTSSNPTTSNSKVISSGTTGTFSVNLTGLSASTTYYARAYAINSEGTAYGSSVSFTTQNEGGGCSVISSFPFIENFDGTTLPNCWDNVNNGGSVGHIWLFGNIGTRGITGTSGNYAYLDSDIYNAGYNQNADLITPTFDFTGYSDVTLDFKYYFRSYPASSSSVSYSINNGATWTQLKSWTSDSPNPETNSIDVPQAAGQSAVKFKWNYTADNGWYVSLDEIEISATTGTSTTLPTVSTNSVSSVTQTTAVAGGNVTSDGGATVTQRGVCYSTSSNPTTGNSKVTSTGTTGSFSVNISGLTASTTYYARAYAINSVGTAYGSQVSFTTQSSGGGCSVVSSFPYSENFDATTLPECWDNVNNGGTTGQVWEFGDIGTKGITGTSGNYAYLDSDTYGSGNNQNADLITPTFDFTGYSEVTLEFKVYFKEYTNSSASLSYSINGGSTWATIKTWTASTVNPEINSINVTSQVSGQSNVKFKWNYTGVYGWYISMDEVVVTATTGTSATIPAVNTNTVSSVTQTSAVAGGNVTSDGGAAISQRGVCYSTSSNPTTNNSIVIASGTTGSFTANLSGLTASTTYYVKAYAINSEGTAYGSEVSFTTQGTSNTIPTVSTSTVSSITETTATAGGNVTSDGGAAISQRGVCYSTSSNPTTSNSIVIASGTTGSFTANLSGLTASTTYYVRAYAINSEGTAYGSEVSFTTEAGSGGSAYCDAVQGTYYAIYISNVTLGSINNTTGLASTGYIDYTSISTSVTKGSNVNLSVSFVTWDSYIDAWIDWNQDGDFDDADEHVMDKFTGTSPTTQSISVPSSAISGSTRMRVRMAYWTDLTPCNTTTYGETEDYTIIVGAPSPDSNPNKIAIDNNVRYELFPNPAQNVLNVRRIANDNAESILISVYNMSGQLVQKEELNNSGTIHIDQLQSGIYHMLIKENDKVVSKRFIVTK